jgi:hypothetical protein
MDRCEEDVIICTWTFSSFRRRKARKTKYWIHNVFRATKEEGKFHALFGRLKDNGKRVLKYLIMSILKFEKMKQLLHTEN